MDDRIVQNGKNFECRVCGAIAREVPTCDECEPQVMVGGFAEHANPDAASNVTEVEVYEMD